ncbi:MAG: DUF72 domain-containing protein [Candidatus Pacearchaeota archaeon]|nr:DUF72 domain-containing protein [Candidatus Pacearchaeota archaeon]
MEVFVGTSGWFYGWNKNRSLDWFVKNSGLNAIELNASFYKFPFPNQIKSWAEKGQSLRWAVKVNRLVTHVYKFNKEALKIWKRFYKLFKPLNSYIDFYLFQLPPTFIDIKKVLDFAKQTKLKKRFALELRNKGLIENLDEKEIKKINEKITLVSLDSPDFYNKIFPGKTVYLRMHGRIFWYNYNYSEKELKGIVNKIKEIKPRKTYVFFNNNHNMLKNAKTMSKLLKQTF